jgi:hypothetical protein
MRIHRPDFTPRLVSERPAPRLVRGDEPVRIGVLHNRKQNADVLIGRLAQNLADDLGGVVVYVDAKDHAAIPSPPDLLDAVAMEAQVVFTGSGD